jgi:hypothetical protein
VVLSRPMSIVMCRGGEAAEREAGHGRCAMAPGNFNEEWVCHAARRKSRKAPECRKRKDPKRCRRSSRNASKLATTRRFSCKPAPNPYYWRLIIYATIAI